jgi:hypothetical protein
LLEQRREEIYRDARKIRSNFDKRDLSYPPGIASACSSMFCPVQNVVDKVNEWSVVSGPLSFALANHNN